MDLQAPLLCPTDTREINDGYDHATTITTTGILTDALFDIETDEDWFQAELAADAVYTIQTANLSTGVDTILELYEPDGVTLLASDDNSGDGLASRLVWQTAVTGTYFLRVAQAPGSAYGCSAAYELSIIELENIIYLPVIIKP